MPDLPPELQALPGLKRYKDYEGESHVVFFVRRKAGETLIMWIGHSDDLARYVWTIRRNARLTGWDFTDVYHARVEDLVAKDLATALQRHYRPLMNKVRMRPDTRDQRILRSLGLT